MLWNVRNLEESELARDYEKLLIKYGTDYVESNAMKFDKTTLSSFFDPYKMQLKSFKHSQYFDWEGFKGRLLSTSYSLRPGDDNYDAMLQALRQIFDRYQKNGKVEFLYNTKLYYSF